MQHVAIFVLRLKDICVPANNMVLYKARGLELGHTVSDIICTAVWEGRYLHICTKQHPNGTNSYIYH